MRRSYAVWRAFWSDRRAAVAAVFLLVEIALVLFLPLFLGQDPNLTDRSAGFWAAPSAQHWLGTDDVGRDLFARLLYGGRTSLLVGFASAALGVVLGVPLGLLAGYKGGAWEYWIMRACDTFQSFPSIILVLAMVSLLGPSVWNIIWVIGGLGWASVARLVYSGTLSTKQTGYVEASRALGATDRAILFRTILPNVIAPVWAALPLKGRIRIRGAHSEGIPRRVSRGAVKLVSSSKAPEARSRPKAVRSMTRGGTMDTTSSSP